MSKYLFLQLLLTFSVSICVHAMDSKLFTFSGYVWAGAKHTQFFEKDFNTAVVEVDSRIEFWPTVLYNSESEIKLGPYLRLSAIDGSVEQAWQNAYLAKPGYGFQLYPFSLLPKKGKNNALVKILSPLRLFVEKNDVEYKGFNSDWRPTERERYGFEYWRAHNVNNNDESYWLEFWGGGIWNSSNDFSNDYDSLLFMNSFKVGRRMNSLMEGLSVYCLQEASFNVDQPYAWDNRIDIGVGFRYTPNLEYKSKNLFGINYFTVFIEGVWRIADLQDKPSESIPDYDLRAGAQIGFGQWWWR